MYIKRHAAKESPETDDAVEKWCTDIFAAKVVSINTVLDAVACIEAFVLSYSNYFYFEMPT